MSWRSEFFFHVLAGNTFHVATKPGFGEISLNLCRAVNSTQNMPTGRKVHLAKTDNYWHLKDLQAGIAMRKPSPPDCLARGWREILLARAVLSFTQKLSLMDRVFGQSNYKHRLLLRTWPGVGSSLRCSRLHSHSAGSLPFVLCLNKALVSCHLVKMLNWFKKKKTTGYILEELHNWETRLSPALLI